MFLLSSASQIFSEPRERFAPGGLRRRLVVALATVVVKRVVDVRIDDLAESLAVLRHPGLGRRDGLVHPVVPPGVDAEHRGPDSRPYRSLHLNTVEMRRRPQVAHADGAA